MPEGVGLRMGGCSVSDQIQLVNINEEFVKQKTRETIRELGGCDCDICFANACALALNDLTPHYVTTKTGAKISEITSMKLCNQTEIIVAVTKAVQKVMEHPHHEK